MKLNYMALICGPVEWGKTTVMSQIYAEALRCDVRVWAHDQNGQFPFPFYADAAALRRALREAAAAKQPLPLAASIGGSYDDLAQLAVEVGRACNSMDDVREGIVLGADEATLIDGSGPTWISQLHASIAANRRHLGVAPVFNMQEPKQLSEKFWKACTDAIIMRMPDGDDAWVARHMSLRKGALTPLVGEGCREFQYLHVRNGKGIQPAGTPLFRVDGTRPVPRPDASSSPAPATPPAQASPPSSSAPPAPTVVK